MRYESLQYALETAKCHSMRKAAEELYMTQPALSEAISILERDLGYPLFERSYNGVILTQEGELALPLMEEILNLTEKLRRIPIENSEGINFSMQGTLNIYAVQYFVTNHLAPSCISFNRRFPNILLNISAYSAEEIVHNCLEGNCDVGFISFPTSMDINIPDGLILKKLFKLPLYLVVSEDSPLAERKSISLKKIPDNYRLVVINSGNNRSDQWDREIFRDEKPIHVAQFTNDFSLVVNNMRINKHLVSLIPCSNEMEKNYKFSKLGLKLIPLKEKVDLQFYTVYHERKVDCECLRTFLEFADSIIQQEREKIAGNTEK